MQPIPNRGFIEEKELLDKDPRDHKKSRFSIETRKKMSLAKLGKSVGEKHWAWSGGKEEAKKRRKRNFAYRRKMHLCKDCGNGFYRNGSYMGQFCDECRKPQLSMCSYCQKDFFISRPEYEDGRGLYCRQKCFLDHRALLTLSGSESHSWKGGWKNIKGYMTPYQQAYRSRKMNAHGTYTRKEWEDLKERCQYMCLCCKKTEPEISLSADHIIPLSRGGDNTIQNIQPLCRRCNSRKRAETIDFISPYFESQNAKHT